MVIRNSQIIPDMKAGQHISAHLIHASIRTYTGFFECTICSNSLVVEVDRGRIQGPAHIHRHFQPIAPQSRRHARAASKSFQIVHNRCKFADKQSVKLQETPGVSCHPFITNVTVIWSFIELSSSHIPSSFNQKYHHHQYNAIHSSSSPIPDTIPNGQTPQTVVAFAYDDLVDYVSPGDRFVIRIRTILSQSRSIEVTGVYRASPLRVNPRQRTVKVGTFIFIDRFATCRRPSTKHTLMSSTSRRRRPPACSATARRRSTRLSHEDPRP